MHIICHMDQLSLSLMMDPAVAFTDNSSTQIIDLEAV